jgi:hypothetical protein
MMCFPDEKIAVAAQVNTSAPRATGIPLRGLIVELVEVLTDS